MPPIFQTDRWIDLTSGVPQAIESFISGITKLVYRSATKKNQFVFPGSQEHPKPCIWPVESDRSVKQIEELDKRRSTIH